MGSWIVLPNQIELPYEYFYPSNNKVNDHDNYDIKASVYYVYVITYPGGI